MWPAMSSLVIVHVASPARPTVILFLSAPEPCVPPTHAQSLAAYPAAGVSANVHASAFNVASESTGLVPDRSFPPVPSADSGKSATVFVPPLSFTTTLRKCSFGAMSSLVIVQVASPARPTVILFLSTPEPCVPPTQTQSLAAYPAAGVSDNVHVSAFNVASESTGLVPDRSFPPVPSADSGKSATVFVPPLSFTTTLRKCSFGAMSSLVIVQVASPARPTVILFLSTPEPCVPPTQTQSLAAYPAAGVSDNV